jgi:HAD superfamily hydrolase (TIGR01490 family)
MKAPVLIVGAGPTGLVLAYHLQKQGIACHIIERRKDKESTSKALSINPLSLQILDGMDAMPELLAKGQKTEAVTIHFENRRLSRVQFKTLNTPFPFFLMLPQPETEKIMEDRLNALGGQVDYGCELLSFTQDAAGILAHMRTASGSETWERYRFLVGCDGARSTVRQLLEIPFEGYDYAMHFVMADVKASWSGNLKEAHYFVKDKGFCILLPLTNQRHRVVIKKEGRWHPDAMPAFEDIQRLMRSYGPTDLDLDDPSWISGAAFYNRLAAAHRSGSVFLAGDAAHLFSPIGGLGMNTGIGDAYNLAWRLAFSLKNGASDELLQDYHNERHALAQQLVQHTDRSTSLIARLDRHEREAEADFLPRFSNRGFIRSQLPSQASGLAQHYQKPGVHESQSLKGKLLPYGRNLRHHHDSQRGLRSSSRHRLIIFSDDLQTLRDLNSEGSSQSAWLEVVGITCDLRPAGLDASLPIYIDAGRQWQKTLGLPSEGWLLVRPDQYIENMGRDAADRRSRFSQQTPLSIARETDMKPYAFFDVDGTLINLKSMFSFLDFLQADSFKSFLIPNFERKLAEFKVRSRSILGREDLNRAYYRILAGALESDLDSLGAAWFRSESRKAHFYNEDALALLRERQLSGDVVLVSGSFSSLLHPLAQELGVNTVLCAPLEIQNGRLTGELTGAPMIGQGKAEAIQSFLRQKSAAAEPCHAFGDDISDLPMLLSVGKPNPVYPEPELEAYALAHRWPILRKQVFQEVP